jgi:hypothetical protein
VRFNVVDNIAVEKSLVFLVANDEQTMTPPQGSGRRADDRRGTPFSFIRYGRQLSLPRRKQVRNIVPQRRPYWLSCTILRPKPGSQQMNLPDWVSLDSLGDIN